MKREVKGFRNNFRKFKAAAKNVPCATKLPLIWEMVEECLEKGNENVEFVSEKWREFTINRIITLENKLGIT